VSEKTIRTSLPSIYAPLLPAAFDESAIHESRATCDNCQMCDQGTVPAELRASYFRPDTKCCTYHPALPNYLVGAVLADARTELDEGKKRLRAQIAKGVGVSPQRLGPSKKWTLLYKSAVQSSFGRSRLLRCPYLDEKERCSIWHHREAVCATFYCKFDGGAAGASFWKTLKAYLNVTEEALSVWAAKQVDASIGDPRHDDTPGLSLADFEERAPDPPVYRKYWGNWVGREEEFYLACHEHVRGLSREQYEKIVDKTSAGAAALEKLAVALDKLRSAPRLPERAALNKKLRVLPVDGGVVLTMPYNVYDSIKIEPELYEVLQKFTHEGTLAEARAKLHAEEGIELEDALLSMFAVHDILVPPPIGGTCDPAAAPKLSGGIRCGTSALKKSSEDL
jgi:Fe-S-cluster containining protein